jgi:hypothetical protein
MDHLRNDVSMVVAMGRYLTSVGENGYMMQ